MLFPKEIWKNIDGIKDYQVSNLGKVRSLKFGKKKILAQRIRKDGYLDVNLYINGERKKFLVHTLIAKVFLKNDNPIEKTEVNHIDECKSNNCAWNLEFVTRKENVNYGTHNKRMSKSLTNHNKISKKVLCVETGVIYPSANEVFRQLGLYTSSISLCCNGKQKTCGGYHWRYVE